MSNNLFKQDTLVGIEERRRLKNQNSFVLWFTGLSGSGKSTLASHLHKKFTNEGIFSYMLDGDNIRLGINSDLDFTELGRKENIRRIAEVSKLFIDSGEIVLSAFISPYIADRHAAKMVIGESNFYEVFIDTPIEECESRDVKGLYKRARDGEIKNFTGIDSPYEAPINPYISIKTKDKSIEQCVDEIYKHIKTKIQLS